MSTEGEVFNSLFELQGIKEAIGEYVKSRYRVIPVDGDFVIRKAGRVRRLEHLMQDYLDWWDADISMDDMARMVRSAWYFRGVFKNILEFSNVYGILQRMHREGLLPGARFSWSRVYYVDLRAFGDWEGLRRSFSRNVWKNVRHFRNRLSREYGEWSVDRWNDIEGAFRFVMDALQRRFSSDNLGDPSYRLMMHRVIRCLHESGLLVPWVLRAGRKVLAVNFIIEKGGIAFSYMAGYDMGSDAYRFLIFHLIKHYYEKGFRQFNFMKGESRYKTQWTDRFYRLYRVEFPHPVPVKRLISAII